MGLREYGMIVRRQWWVLLGALSITLASTIFFFHIRTPTYSASATVILEKQDPLDRFLTDQTTVPSAVNVDVDVAFATSPAVLNVASGAMSGVRAVDLARHVAAIGDARSKTLRMTAT